MKIALAAACLVVFGACDAVDPSIPAKQEMRSSPLAQAVQPIQQTPAKAPHPWEAGDGTNPGMAGEDQEFLRKAAERAIAEVQFGNLVLEKGTHTALRNFAWRMVTDYSTINRQLARLAAAKAIALPSELRADQKIAFSRMAKLSGEEFDLAYLSHVEYTGAEPRAFERASTSATDPDVKAFAWQALSSVRDHEALVKETAESYRRDKNRVISIQ
ncbi:MAG TPA: DUF4142 domain-containing protein [Thermoanaerobaculia bacterium]|nr:DUF4142 domain-containing protein [Thermoanaerobaculia bacterium]